MGTSYATADGRPDRETRIAYVMLAVCLLALVGGVGNIIRLAHADFARKERVSQAVYAALADPAYVERAGAAGYRVGLIRPQASFTGTALVKASCARANEAGPLPCGLFPYDPDHPDVMAQIAQ